MSPCGCDIMWISCDISLTSQCFTHYICTFPASSTVTSQWNAVCVCVWAAPLPPTHALTASENLSEINL